MTKGAAALVPPSVGFASPAPRLVMRSPHARVLTVCEIRETLMRPLSEGGEAT